MNVRDATPADVADIAAICNAVTRELYGEGDASEDLVATWFEMPEIVMRVAELDGRVAGYADTRSSSEGMQFPFDVRVAPHARGRGVADALIADLETWARPRAKTGALARGFSSEKEVEVRGALERSGFRLVRHFFHMHIELPPHVEPPQWPEGITVRVFDEERDLANVHACVEETFADHWGFHPTPIDEWRAVAMQGATFDPSLWWLAEDGGELAGFTLNYRHVSGDPTFGWVGTLGVRAPWRRRGLALALLRHSFVDFKERGATRVGLGVDTENTTGAVALYERAGMHATRRNDTYEKPL